jgi:flavin reductase (DIM6/NTAB) family NADH-FMN oxidoreductase RutF
MEILFYHTARVLSMESPENRKKDLCEFYHRLLCPRVAALVVALREDGKPNVMPVAWHTPVSVRPPILAVCISPSRYTHSLILKNKEFTVNIPDLSMKDAVEITGSKSGKVFDKSSIFKFTPATKVNTPLIEGALASIECELNQAIDIGDHSVVFGNVVACQASGFREVWKGTSPLLHLGSNFYTVIKEGFLR